jgi:anti-anti-sigma regulatory factor
MDTTTPEAPMTADVALELASNVDTVYLADGKLVRLSGSLGAGEVAALRLALLMPMSPDCRDVVIDAGDITDICDEAVAVLIAARWWAADNGARFLTSRTSPALEQTLRDLDLVDDLPALPPLGGPHVPAQRRPGAEH